MNAAAERVEKGMWWDRAWKLVEGCSPMSPGCEHCWSARETHMRAGQSCDAIRARCEGITTAAGAWTGAIRVRCDNLDLPRRARRRYVWAVWNDLFHEDAEIGFVLDALETMYVCDGQTFVLLSKRAERLATVWQRFWVLDGPPANVIVGISAENQEWLDRRWEQFRNVRCAAKFISYEPALGPIRLPEDFLAMGPRAWVACQGESGPGARPMHPDWARSVRDQCAAAGVRFFFKGWGEFSCWPYYDDCLDREWHLDRRHILMRRDGHITDPEIEGQPPPGTTIFTCVGKQQAGRILDGRTWDEFPEVG